MTSLRRDVVANVAGQASAAVLGLVFVPLHIRFLGVEAYGPVGFSVSLFAVLRIADLGFSSTLNREFARLSATPGVRQHMRGLLFKMQAVYRLISTVLAITVVAMAPAIASGWFRPGSVPAQEVTRAVALMGLGAVLQCPMGLYNGGLPGLQRAS